MSEWRNFGLTNTNLRIDRRGRSASISHPLGGNVIYQLETAIRNSAEMIFPDDLQRKNQRAIMKTKVKDSQSQKPLLNERHTVNDRSESF
ncbi:hypothetical protein [Effusibacillus pohliae]|uniref:hypothetical protein n=1 Tax=Effusibacillus pohliae TaxID=232270 RepID=UPI000371D1E1|nr:hypothetical protein [Effusibacillus pohliae]